MAAATVQFGATAPILGPAGPSQRVPNSAYSILRTGSGDVVVYNTRDVASVPEIWTLTFPGMTTAERDIVQGFFESQNGPSTTWNFISTDGVTYTARFLNESLPWSRFGGVWSVTMQLEITGVVPPP